MTQRRENPRPHSAGHRELSIPAWVLVGIVTYVIVFGALALRKHGTYNSFTFDLGILSHVTYNTSQGRLFETSLDRAQHADLVGNYLGNHVRPVLLLLAPLYRLWPDPRLLLLLQTVVLGMGAIPIFWTARREVQAVPSQGSLVIAYLLYPALGFLNLFDFHPVAFSIPALLLAHWALNEDRPYVFWAMIGVSLSTKEEMVVPIAAFGIYCLTQRRWRKKGCWLVILATVWALTCFLFLIPAHNEGRPYRFLRLWQHLLPAAGSGMKPLSGLVDRLLSRGVMYFLIHLLVPLAFLPFLGPAIIAVALPSTAYLLTSKSSHLYQIGSQYPAVLIPWALLATVRGLSRIEEWPWSSEIMRRWLPAGLLVTGTLGANLVVNPVYVAWRSGYFTDWQRNEAVQVALRQIPSEAGVMTINSLGAEVTNRQVLMAAEQYGLLASQSHLEEVDYVLLDLVDCRLFGGSDPRLTYAQFVRALLESGSFRIDRWEGRILLLRRDESSTREETLTQVQEYVNSLVEEKRPCWP